MGILGTSQPGVGALKAGLFGPLGSGKTHTATLLALAARRHFQSPGPIVWYDSERGSPFMREWIERETGRPMLVTMSRSFSDLLLTVRGAVDHAAAALIIDSVTHPWEELIKSFMARVNERRRSNRLNPLSRPGQDEWVGIKEIWREFSEMYVNTPLNIVACGRAGAVYEREAARGDQKARIERVGTKMRAGDDFGYEPNILIEMERVELLNPHRILRRARILKDRSRLLDGKIQDNPTAEFFAPHLQFLTPAQHQPVNVGSRTAVTDEQAAASDIGIAEQARGRLLNEIKGLLVTAFPGQTAADKARKGWHLNRALGTRDWLVAAAMSIDQLEGGLQKLRDDPAFAPHVGPVAPVAQVGTPPATPPASTMPPDVAAPAPAIPNDIPPPADSGAQAEAEPADAGSTPAVPF